jgi:5-(carboxyamino)imidazole ribonucleotide mutase
MANPLVSILMGSKNDLEVLDGAREVLRSFGVGFETRVLSAHRTPDALFAYVADADKRGVEVFIAGAGGAAHLPGVVAAKTLRPVLGVPIASTPLLGIDSLLAIVQMPKGTPVATFAVGKPGASNAAIFAVMILGQTRPELSARLAAHRLEQAKTLAAAQVID